MCMRMITMRLLVLFLLIRYSLSRLSPKSLSLNRKFDEIESLYFIDNLFSSVTQTKQPGLQHLLTICDLNEGESISFNEDEFNLSFLSIKDSISLQKYLQIKYELKSDHSNSNIKSCHITKVQRTRNPAYRRILTEKRSQLNQLVSHDVLSSTSTMTNSKQVTGSFNKINSIISNKKVESMPSEANIIMSEYIRQKDVQSTTTLKPIDEQIWDLYCSQYRPFKTIKLKIYNKTNQLVLHQPKEISVLSSTQVLIEELHRLEVSNPTIFSCSFSNLNSKNITCRILKSATMSFVDVKDLNMSLLRCGVTLPSAKIQLFYE